LVPGTVRVITARMDYLPRDADDAWSEREHARLRAPHEAVVSIYARGRDYHKVLRQRLQQLAERLEGAIGPFGHRVFTDSAPVLEVELAQRQLQRLHRRVSDARHHRPVPPRRAALHLVPHDRA
jgi:epoxyqueuosine reductase